MTSCYTEITKLCVISVYFFYYITSYVIPLKEAAFFIEGNCDMGLRRCLFQIKSILVICQELFEEDFDMFFRKKGNFNRPSVYFTYNRMSVRLNIIFGVQLFAGVQLVFDQQSKNESY